MSPSAWPPRAWPRSQGARSSARRRNPSCDRLSCHSAPSRRARDARSHQGSTTPCDKRAFETAPRTRRYARARVPPGSRERRAPRCAALADNNNPPGSVTAVAASTGGAVSSTPRSEASHWRMLRLRSCSSASTLPDVMPPRSSRAAAIESDKSRSLHVLAPPRPSDWRIGSSA